MDHHGPQSLRGIPAAACTYPQPRCTCSHVALSMDHCSFRGVPVPAWPSPWPQSLQGCTCCDVDLSTATDASRSTSSGVDLSTVTDASGCLAPMWTYPQVTVPLTPVHTGVPACPVQQHRNSSNALAICQTRCMAVATIKMVPGTAE